LVIYGIYYAAALLAGAGVVVYLTNWYFALPFLILALFCLYFFRDPDREIPHYQQGQFLVASKEEASHSNEQNVITVEGPLGRIEFKQIAGLIARRIVCYKKLGDILVAGERVGLIKFGSRVDVQLGPDWEVTVRVGQRVAAGSSVIARKKS
jgi:phosphatidylserine decarboxylase